MYYLELNKIYYIQCIPQFEDLNGVYEIVQKKNYAELIREGIDIVAHCYSKVGLTQQDWQADAANMQDETFYKLEYPGDTSNRFFIWLPDSKIASYPDSNVFRYKKLMLMTDLGIFDNEDDLSSTVSTLKELLATNLGIVSEPRVSAYGDIWLSKQQYEDIENIRETASGEVVNCVSENKKLINQLSKANARIAALEDLVAALSNQP